eukprot:10642-Heterococcus_DN1.PRE.1
MNTGCCGLVPALNASHLLQADYAGGQARALASYQLQPVACRKIARLLSSTAANTFDAGLDAMVEPGFFGQQLDSGVKRAPATRDIALRLQREVQGGRQTLTRALSAAQHCCSMRDVLL